MKITRVSSFLIEYPFGSESLLVRIDTDAGIAGWGECSPMNVRVISSYIRHALAPYLIGQDPFDVELLLERMFVENYKIAGQSLAIAMSGVEVALWDVMGKALGVPVYKLLGGAYRKKVRVYASSMSRSITPEREAERLAKLVEEKGFTAVKVRIGKRWGFDEDVAPGRSEAVVREVRKRLGEGVDIMVDANSCFTASRAIEIGRRLEKYGIFWFEEPCPYLDLDSAAKVAQALDIPVALGEQEWDLRRFKEMMQKGAADVVQPDPIKAGGLSICKKVAALAEAFGCVCAPHQTQPLGTVVALHFVAATPCCRYPLEYNIEENFKAKMSLLLKKPLEVIDGHLEVPEEPGLGVKINEEAVRRLACEVYAHPG